MAKKAKGKPLAEGEEPPKKDNKKKIIIVVALVAAWKLGFLPIGGSKDASAVTTTTAMWAGDAVDVGEPMVVNLADEDKTTYAKVAIALVLPGHGENPDAAGADAGHAMVVPSLAPVPGGFGGGRAGVPQVLPGLPDQGGGAEDPVVALEKKFPRMRAAAVEIIRTYTSAELLAEDGPMELADELTDAGHEIFGEHDIYGVIVTDLVVQT